MRRWKKNSSLFDVAPNVVKEWHPTSNGNLTPRNVKIGYPEKVWWICAECHEWQAKIKCRLKQNDCPLCEKEADRKKAIILMGMPGIEKNYRKSRRHKTNTIGSHSADKRRSRARGRSN